MELTGIVDAREALRSVMAVLADLPVAADESETVDRISLMESIKAACAAGQAADTLRLQELRSAAEAEAGVPVERRCRGLSGEVALARRVSGTAGGRHVG
ncbi:MAG: HNH endonuclease, partial [Williamsia herbipolensis]|nr:HNH endonuclease [Williamsia herbipolensis]